MLVPNCAKPVLTDPHRPAALMAGKGCSATNVHMSKVIRYMTIDFISNFENDDFEKALFFYFRILYITHNSAKSCLDLSLSCDETCKMTCCMNTS